MARTLVLELFGIGLLTLVGFSPELGAKTIYVDNASGDDSREGVSEKSDEADGPVRTFTRAVTLLEAGDTLYIVPTSEPYREPLILEIEGTEEAPIIIEGNGATIDLGHSGEGEQWTQDGEYWAITSDKKLGKQQAMMFLHGLPFVMPRQPLADGEVAAPYQFVKPDGDKVRVRFPEGGEPPFAKLYMLGEDKAVYFKGAKHIVVRNLNVRGASNDGFGLHGACEGVVVENSSAILCGDEGASAHGPAQAVFKDCLFAWNGSFSGGVTDVHETKTDYIRCISAFGRGAGFSLRGKQHRLIDSYSLGNGRAEDAFGQPGTQNFTVIENPAEATAKAQSLAPNSKQMDRLVEYANEIGWNPGAP